MVCSCFFVVVLLVFHRLFEGFCCKVFGGLRK